MLQRDCNIATRLNRPTPSVSSSRSIPIPSCFAAASACTPACRINPTRTSSTSDASWRHKRNSMRCLKMRKTKRGPFRPSLKGLVRQASDLSLQTQQQCRYWDVWNCEDWPPNIFGLQVYTGAPFQHYVARIPCSPPQFGRKIIKINYDPGRPEGHNNGIRAQGRRAQEQKGTRS